MKNSNTRISGRLSFKNKQTRDEIFCRTYEALENIPQEITGFKTLYIAVNVCVLNLCLQELNYVLYIKLKAISDNLIYSDLGS